MDHIIQTKEEADAAAGVGTELGRMMRAALNPNPETWQEREARRAREAFAKAAKINAKDYAGWVCWPGKGDEADGFFESVDKLLKHCADDHIDPPEWVWACRATPLKLDADWILDQALEEHHDGARDSIPSREEHRLQMFLDDWAADQKIVSWHEDRTRAVLLVPEQEIHFPKPTVPPPIYVAMPSRAETSTEALAEPDVG